MKLKDHKDFPNVTNLKRVGHANKHYINGLKTMRDRCGEIEVLERLDKEKIKQAISGFFAGDYFIKDKVDIIAKVIYEKFGTPKIDEGRVAFKCVDAIDGHIISLDGEQKELCYQAIAKELSGNL